MIWYAGLMHRWPQNEITLKAELFLLHGIINVLWSAAANLCVRAQL